MSAPRTAPVELDAALVEGLVSAFLAVRFDQPVAIPPFHRDMWKLCCAPHPRVAIAAPRGFAKSTAVTHSYGLAALLFRQSSYALIVSDTEGQAVQFLTDMKMELKENEHLRKHFHLSRWIRDSEAEIEIEMGDGHRFRVTAKGSEQKVRGSKWRHQRPDLVLVDDSENEELTANPDRREKFRRWFFNALLPSGSRNCRFRVVGTILHFDSLLERLLNDSAWLTARFRAHVELDNFSGLLWPEMWPEQRLRDLRQTYMNQGNLDGYAQELLNYPMDESVAYFRRGDLLELESRHRYATQRYFAAVDFAISTKQRADFTVIAVGGVGEDGIPGTVDVYRERLDGQQILDMMFDVQVKYGIEVWFAEAGQIEKALGPFLRAQMLSRNIFLNIQPITPVADKQTRARPFQARVRAGGWRFDKEAAWYPTLEDEMLRFPKGAHDDQVDAHGMLARAFDELYVEGPVEEDDGVYWAQPGMDGRSAVCGY